MVGGNSAMKSKKIERLFNGEFPEKPGALPNFLKNLEQNGTYLCSTRILDLHMIF